jgi:GGDEF domain-containing protein
MCAMQKTSWGNPHGDGKGGSPIYNPELCLTLLVEGASLGVPEVDTQSYRRFRSNVEHLVQQLASQLPAEDKIALIHSIIHEFETYRAESETAIRDQLIGWRNLIAKLFGKLLTSLGIEQQAPDAFSLSQRIRHLATAADVQDWDERLDRYLRPAGGPSVEEATAARLSAADHSTANDNAAGLPGGGKALEKVDELIKAGGKGFVALFRLGCLELINDRFGDEAVEDCLMAIANYLTRSLRREDAIYHWSDTTLLAIIQGRTNEHILNAELKRISSQNRDVSINIGDRVVMLRIPLEFDVLPISRIKDADDIRKFSLESASS